MPDLITWNPRIGATGDDRYTIPPGTRIEVAGASFSDPPTLAEVNAALGLNQVVAEINRRRRPDDWVVNDVDPLDYCPGGRIAAAFMATLRAAIDDIRENECRAAYSWGALPAVGGRILGAHLADMREALATDWLFVGLNLADHEAGETLKTRLRRQDNSYPPTTTSVLAVSDQAEIGQRYVAPTYSKFRDYLFFRPPGGVSLDAAVLSVFIGPWAETAEFDVEAWRATNHLAPLGIDDWGNLDALEDDFHYEYWPFRFGKRVELTLDPDGISGSGNTFILVSEPDRLDDAPSGVEYCYLGFDRVQGSYPFLKLFLS